MPTPDLPISTILPPTLRENLINASKIKDEFQRRREIERLEQQARNTYPEMFHPVEEIFSHG